MTGFDDKMAQLASLFRERWANLTPDQRKQEWLALYGGRLTKIAKAISVTGTSYPEATMSADGRLKFRDGVPEIGDDDFRELLGIAQKDIDAFELILKICALRLSENAALTANQRLVVAGVLMGKIQRPARGRGRRRGDHWARDRAIVEGVQSAQALGYQLSRGATSSADCAFSLVAEAFEKTGHGVITEDIVRNVWTTAQRNGGLVEELAALDRLKTSNRLGAQWDLHDVPDPEADDS